MSNPFSAPRLAATAAVLSLAIGSLLPAQAQTEAGVPTEVVLHFFGGSAADGVNPVAGVVQAADGNFYGTTLSGGAPGNGGTVFRLTADGVLTTLHAFDARSGSSDGSTPRGALVIGADGRLYGTTEEGGAFGLGTVFAVSTGGNYQLVHSFNGVTGAAPRAGLTRVGGLLFGVASSGGIGNAGTAFRVDGGGFVNRIHAFDAAQGATPQAALSLGSDGNLYGTTQGGGLGDGSVFRLSTAGALNVLHRFAPNAQTGYAGPGSNGVVERAGVVFGSTPGDAGAVAAPGTAGSVFRIESTGGLSTLYRFAGVDGAQPGSLVRSSDGRLYGSTRSGGSDGVGVIFRIADAGEDFRLLHQFTAGSRSADGARPNPLIEDADGRLVGTAFASTLPPRFGRADVRNGAGAVFALYPRAPRISIELIPAIAAAGQPVTIRWTADVGAEGCTASGDWRGARAASGEATVSSARVGERPFRLECANPAGSVTETATLTIAPAPTVTLTASPAFTNNRTPSTTLSWTAVGAATCTASGEWNGPRPISSSVVVTPGIRGRNSYTLSCTGIGGTSSDSVNVFRFGEP